MVHRRPEKHTSDMLFSWICTGPKTTGWDPFCNDQHFFGVVGVSLIVGVIAMGATISKPKLGVSRFLFAPLIGASAALVAALVAMAAGEFLLG